MFSKSFQKLSVTLLNAFYDPKVQMLELGSHVWLCNRSGCKRFWNSWKSAKTRKLSDFIQTPLSNEHYLKKHLFSHIHRGVRDFASKKVWDQRGYPISFGRFSRVSDKWNSEAGKQAVFRAKKSNKNPSFLQKRLDQKLWNKLKFPTHLHQMPIWWIHVFSSCQLVFLSDTTLIPYFIRCSFSQNERLFKSCENSTQTKPKQVLYIQCF